MEVTSENDKLQMEVTLENDNPTSDPKPNVIYRCKKCRRIVASEELVVSHERGKGKKHWRRKAGEDSDTTPECSSIFVEPMKWMETVGEGNMGDKLLCGGCKARLGSFTWIGTQCSCGTWINPAFQLHKSRLDECPI